MTKYDHVQIENKWKEKWENDKLFHVEILKAPKPFYNLMMFPYPSAEGMHVGNMMAFTGADIYGRFQRMNGSNVFEPIGLDGFGIHSENYAISIGKHPQDQAKVSEERFYEQLRMTGNAYDWEHTLETYSPAYYRWTQWIFIQMFKNGLAERRTASVNWCPSCKTVLADEQAEGGICERCKNETERKDTKQWFFKITEYADRLLGNLKKIDWPNKITTAQRNWIGRKEGINIRYSIKDTAEKITCFTTRPDTNFGATFIVVAPEYELISKIIEGKVPVEPKIREAVAKYTKDALNKTEQQRLEEGRNKSGVFAGLYAINQLNGRELPIYVADFVLKDVGTGAVVGVPGHDVRDFEFAQTFNLPVLRVVVGSDGDESDITEVDQVQEENGVMINSEFLDGLEIHKATHKIMEYLEEKGWGEKTVSYHLRDWLISRQRYWGPPIPMAYCEKCGWQPVSEEELPVELPYIKDYEPTGDGLSPLAKAPEEWLYTNCSSCARQAKRETDVSDTFLDSAWYFLAYPNIGTKEWEKGPVPFNSKITQKWLPVNAYIGGAEHAVLHLLYARFVTMALHDWGFLDFSPIGEPFPFLFSHGLIVKDGSKMSKSRGNVIVPDEYIKTYGADAFRTYLMFLGPYAQGGNFKDAGIQGMKRFFRRVWALYTDKNKIGKQTSSPMKEILHKTIQKVTEDIAAFKYNTAIASLMEVTNAWKEEKNSLSISDAAKTLQLLAPFAPFVTEELWEILGQDGSIHTSKWPSYDEKEAAGTVLTIIIQVDGKLRGKLELERKEKPWEQKDIESMTKELEGVAKYTSKGKHSAVYVPDKLINFVSRDKK